MQSNLVRIRAEQGLRFLNSLPSQQQKSAISKAEAEVLVNNIGTASSKIFKNVVILVDSRGHLALGHSKIQDCLRQRCPEISNSYICRLVKAADTFLSLDSSLTNLNRVSEATLRQFEGISPLDQKKVWNIAIEKSDKRITSRDIKRIMDLNNIKAKVDSSHNNLIIDLSLKKLVISHAGQIVGLISPKIKNKEEWKDICRFLYKQLLISCPVTEDQV